MVQYFCQPVFRINAKPCAAYVDEYYVKRIITQLGLPREETCHYFRTKRLHYFLSF